VTNLTVYILEQLGFPSSVSVTDVAGNHLAEEFVSSFTTEAYVFNVEIDIKPGTDPNSINLESKGKVPVTILTSDEFDATDVDPDTVVFAGAEALRCTMEDVDLDGDEDMICHFNTQELELTEDSTEGILTGSTYDDMDIEGTDSVNIVP
jgi:hypothetical protein